MSDYTELVGGRVAHVLEIAGIGVWADADISLSTESWFSSAGYSSIRPWLSWGVEDIASHIDYTTGELSVDDVGLAITDPSGQMTALVRDWRGWTYCHLTATIDDDEVSTITVTDTSTFLSSGSVWIGQERIEYAAKTATTFTGLTRGTFGTEAEEHFADASPPTGLPVLPPVTNGPHSITGRRALLRAAVIDEGTGLPGTSEVIYRGRVTKGTTVGRGVYALALEHLAAVMNDKVGNELPQTTLKRCYWYSGVGNVGGSLSYITLWASPGTIHHVAIGPGLYTVAGLAVEIDAALAALASAEGHSGTWHVHGTVAGKFYLYIENGVGNDLQLTVRHGDPLWALGFDPGAHIVQATAPAYEHEAANEPRWCVVDFAQRAFFGFPDDPQVNVEHAYGFVAENWVAPKEGRHVQISAATQSGFGAADTLTLKGMTYDNSGSEPPLSWIIEEEEDAAIQHVVRISQPLDGALSRLTHVAASQSEPQHWMAHGLRAEDVDTDELADAIDGLPLTLLFTRFTVREPTELWSLVGTQLALLGIVPRLTTSGKIGFTRIQTPIASDAVSPDLDTAVWSAGGAAKITARLDDTPVVNSIRVRYGKDYTTDSDAWPDALNFKWRHGGLSGRTRGVAYDCPGISTKHVTADELIELILYQLNMSHFSTMGRESSDVDIPCIRTARQYRCGDVVSITHELLPDTVMGAVGVTGRIGLVVGLRHKVTDDGADVVTVRLGPTVNAGGIAPCALLDVDDDGAEGVAQDTTLYCPSGDSDLQYFAVNDLVRLIEHDTLSPTEAVVKVSSIDSSAGTVSFTSAIFSATISTPCWMAPADWDDATAGLQVYSFVADDAAAPTLGAGGDDPREWTL